MMIFGSLPMQLAFRSRSRCVRGHGLKHIRSSQFFSHSFYVFPSSIRRHTIIDLTFSSLASSRQRTIQSPLLSTASTAFASIANLLQPPPFTIANSIAFSASLDVRWIDLSSRKRILPEHA